MSESEISDTCQAQSLGPRRWPVPAVSVMAAFLMVAMPAAADCNANGQDDASEFDQDGDGIINACDNCLNVPNPLQTDSNEDGYGNMCDADLNDDGVVNVVDLGVLRERFFSADPDADLNVDGVVNAIDLGLLRLAFFEPPGPGLPESDVTPDADVTDVDGNIYRTIRLGNQIWFRENLKATTFNDGEVIPLYSFGESWNPGFGGPDPQPRYQWADTSDLNSLFDDELAFDFFGALYNDVALGSERLCPLGWRVPSEQDFIGLETFVVNDGFDGQQAAALKSTIGWFPGSLGIDAYGFTAFSAGYVSAQGTATGAGVVATWATTETNIIDIGAVRRVVQLFDNGAFVYAGNSVRLGASVRCIKN